MGAAGRFDLKLALKPNHARIDARVDAKFGWQPKFASELFGVQ
jgi:hypothetical protein